MELYHIKSVAQAGAVAAAERGRHTASTNTLLLVNLTTQQAMQQLSHVAHIFSDADGTLVSDGAEHISQATLLLLATLSRHGITTTVVTGKPLAEVTPMLSSAPGLEFICEKGAYRAHIQNGTVRKQFMLSDAAIETEVALFRIGLARYLQGLTRRHHIGFGWAGSGAHTSIISVDLYAATPPAHYTALRGAARNALKLRDPALQRRLESLIARWVHQHKPTWQVVHLGNGNTEITPPILEKSAAVRAHPAFAKSGKVLILGDSKNDEPMFALRATHTHKVLNGLVLHQHASLPLVNTAHFVTFGMANVQPILQALLSTKK